MSRSSSKTRTPFEPVDHAEMIQMWRSRFGIAPEVFDGYSFYRRGHNVWIFSLSEVPDLRSEALGLRFVSTKGRVWKPTTYALQLFGHNATRNTVELDPEQAGKFIAGEDQRLEADIEDGYVVVSYRGEVLGCGLYTRGQLASQLPKERRIAKGSIEGSSFRSSFRG